MQSLLDKLNKTNEDQVIGVDIYWKRYLLCHTTNNLSCNDAVLCILCTVLINFANVSAL